MRIALVGYMGCGKTSLGQQLSEKIAIPFIDLDQWIEESEGLKIAELFATKGENYFRVKESEALKQVLQTHQTLILATGGGTPCFFNNMYFLNESCKTVYLQCSPKKLLERISSDKNIRPLLSSTNFDLIDHLLQREPHYLQSQYILNGDQTFSELISDLQHLSQSQQTGF